MRYLLAFLLPWLCFLTLRKPIHAIISLVLQLSIIGWPIAIVWAFYGISEHRQQLKAKRLAQAQEQQAQTAETSAQTLETTEDHSNEQH